MSSATANTMTTNQTTSNAGLIIGLTVGGIILLMLIAFFVVRSRKGASVTAPTTANGYGAMNNGGNIVPRTNVNMNSGNGRRV